ncbi:hypothetical protein PMW_14 [Pseudomonas phage phiPMW]|uniref:Uncharacterized protein n=1 Tax=Pseudomonas phage phiPMW TaxID=1815582 RepID=A0A1S5R173_9CAUD|nr:hypothetical protein FDG97_gp014 [Pseudomonas phage phiPMW]ANA49139.1 hypothetical protein PMW_14 [Pseudomonas phage phiPMW]
MKWYNKLGFEWSTVGAVSQLSFRNRVIYTKCGICYRILGIEIILRHKQK